MSLCMAPKQKRNAGSLIYPTFLYPPFWHCSYKFLHLAEVDPTHPHAPHNRADTSCRHSHSGAGYPLWTDHIYRSAYWVKVVEHEYDHSSVYNAFKVTENRNEINEAQKLIHNK